MYTLSPEQHSKIRVAVKALPPLPDESINRLAAILIAQRKRLRRTQ